MYRSLVPFSLAVCAILWTPPTGAQAQTSAPGISLIGQGSLPGTAHDKSGLTGSYTSTEDPPVKIPADQLGAFGSGLAYTGFGHRFIAVNDRGFDNGTTPYLCRFQIFDLAVDPGTKTLTPTLLATRLLTREDGKQYIGSSAAFTGTDATQNLRLDPEGIRVAPDGTFYLSDEYGPVFYHFDQSGKRLAAIPLPTKFEIAHPDADAKAETDGNISGRVTNRGMEGLAITPDGAALVGIMQSPLIQDGGRDGVNARILRVDLKTGKTQEYLYPFDTPKMGVSEIVAVNGHQFLVDERDSKTGTKAKAKNLYLIDLDGATDISAIAQLPLTGTPAGVQPVSKHLFLSLIDPQFGLAGADFPEKIEGLAFGPDLPDGRHTLFVTNDNDLIPGIPNHFYAFAIAPSALPGFQPETVRTPWQIDPH
jgi:hypothetical protein